MSRNTQICNLRQLFLANTKEEFQMVKNCILTEKDKGPTMLVEMLEEEFEDVEALRKCVLSDTFRTMPIVWDLFCKGWESGRMRGTRRREPGPLSHILTISHEANFRLELALAMSTPGE